MSLAAIKELAHLNRKFLRFRRQRATIRVFRERSYGLSHLLEPTKARFAASCASSHSRMASKS